MTNPITAPYGSWKSPITTDLILTKLVGIVEVALDGEDIYWIESRPEEGGRYVVVHRAPDGKTSDLTPPPFNARTRVHEYGGGALVVDRDSVFFSNFNDQRLYRIDPGGEPYPITPESKLRYADGVVHRRLGRLICVCEDHTEEGAEAENKIVSLPLDGGEEPQVLVSGNDFYAFPRLSPDGNRLAWTTWNHPNMPWDGTELWIADVTTSGGLENPQKVAGGLSESIFQPEWSPSGMLYFISDRTNWWNLYRWLGGKIEAVYEMAAEFGRPQWLFGRSTYAFVGDDPIICAYQQSGNDHLATLDIETNTIEAFDLPYTYYNAIQAVPGSTVFISASPTEVSRLVRLDLSTGAFETLRRSSEVEVEPGYLSIPQAIEFPSENGLTAHAFYYPPNNKDYQAPPGEKPPLIVMSHGGPTGATDSTLSLGTQYWTSRGFAVLDVNYGGSTGYGREYRQRLNGNWGVVDVDDCTNAALSLVEHGEVDGERLAIRGGSAGGYTTLAALAFRDVFHAGASHFGLSDLEPFVQETHKFESRYLDGLIGPYHEQADLYRKRSPINYVNQFNCPVIFFQGLEDKIVPPNQAEVMYEALLHKEIPTAYLAFEGEQHGFRKAENIKRVLEAELYFYSKIFGFDLADPVEPVEIENLAIAT